MPFNKQDCLLLAIRQRKTLSLWQQLPQKSMQEHMVGVGYVVETSHTQTNSISLPSCAQCA